MIVFVCVSFNNGFFMKITATFIFAELLLFYSDLFNEWESDKCRPCFLILQHTETIETFWNVSHETGRVLPAQIFSLIT